MALRFTLSAPGAMPSRDAALILPLLCSTTVMLVIPIAPGTAASSFAMSPVFGRTLTLSAIFRFFMQATPSRTTSVSTSDSGRVRAAISSSGPPKAFPFVTFPE